MAPARTFDQPGHNRLLDSLPASDQERLLASMQQVSFDQNDVCYRSRQPVSQVYFPLTMVASELKDFDRGRVEVGNIGNEGMVGLPVYFGTGTASLDSVCQVSGTALAMRSAAFRDEIGQRSALRDLVGCYAQYFTVQVAQTAVCNRVHTIEERLSRWLLMTHDRRGEAELPLTQEFLADMLGVHRPGVTLAARTLQAAGLITYHRGRITILDREGLEATSCECYRITRDEYDRLMS